MVLVTYCLPVFELSIKIYVCVGSTDVINHKFTLYPYFHLFNAAYFGYLFHLVFETGRFGPGRHLAY